MLAPVSYFQVVRQMKNAFDYRLRVVTYARQHAIEAVRRGTWSGRRRGSVLAPRRPHASLGRVPFPPRESV